jgi:3-deoxy-D-manno-octulosonic acid kinase
MANRARRLPEQFVGAEVGRRELILSREFAPKAAAIVAAADRTLKSSKDGAGNRGSGFRIEVEGTPPLFVRRSIRGGAIAFMGDLHLGFAPRVIRELAVTSEARKRGVPAPEPIGAIIERIAPAIHRAALITRYIRGMTLWELLRAEEDVSVRSLAARTAREAIDAMHRAGIFHGDLNLHNLFVSTESEALKIAILDFDKARVHRAPLTPGLRRRNFARLARSIRKLDPERRYLDEEARRVLTES